MGPRLPSLHLSFPDFVLLSSAWNTCQYVMTRGGQSQGMINEEMEDEYSRLTQRFLQCQELALLPKCLSPTSVNPVLPVPVPHSPKLPEAILLHCPLSKSHRKSPM